MAIRNKATFAKRERERAKQQKRREKEEKRLQRQAEKEESNPVTPPHEDPDIAGIVPGPQPIPEHHE